MTARRTFSVASPSMVAARSTMGGASCSDSPKAFSTARSTVSRS